MVAKSLLSITTASVLTVGLLTGCTTSSNSADKSTAESTTETLPTDDNPLKVLTNVTGGKDDEEMQLFNQAVSDAVGFPVVFEKPTGDYEETLTKKLQSGEIYDMIYLNQNDMINFEQQGVLTDITDWVNNSDVMQNNIDPQEWADIAVDGKYYAGFNKMEVWLPVCLNNTQLINAGIDYTQIDPTLDGYYDVFKTLKESNSTEGYYPLNICLSDCWDLQPWFASVGLKGGVITDPSDGKTYVPYSTDDAAPVWEWLNKLYSEQLLDPSCLVDKTTDMRGKMGPASQLTTCNVDWAAWVGIHNSDAITAGISQDDYDIVSLPGTKTPDGSYMLRKGNASLWGIPTNAQFPEQAFKVMEFFATQEGGELLSLGVEGYDYTLDSDGAVALTDIGTQHSKDHGAPFPIDKNFDSSAIGGYNRGVDEALSYKPYATIETPIPDEADYKEVMGKWACQMVSGKVSIPDGLNGMRQELVQRGICDK